MWRDHLEVTSTERWRKWKANNPDAREKLRLKHKKWRAGNPEKCREKRKKWGERHREHVRQYLKEWNKLNPWRGQQYKLKWLSQNPEASLSVVMASMDVDDDAMRSCHTRIPDENQLDPFEILCLKEENDQA